LQKRGRKILNRSLKGKPPILFHFCSFLNKSIQVFFIVLKYFWIRDIIDNIFTVKTSIFRYLFRSGRFFINWPNLEEFAEKLWKDLATVVMVIPRKKIWQLAK
jgi:hypothetical protein